MLQSMESTQLGSASSRGGLVPVTERLHTPPHRGPPEAGLGPSSRDGGCDGRLQVQFPEPSTVGTHFFSVMLQNEMEERAEEVPRGSCPGANAGMWVCASRLPPWVASSSTSKATPLFVMSESVAWVGTACLPQP